MQLNVIIPVYNEDEIIEYVIHDWYEVLEKQGIDFMIHVYDDGSKDRTFKILKQMSEEYLKLVVHKKQNSGHGPTILQGFRENCNSEWLFQVDSDNEISPKYFKVLWKERGDYDFLVGQRVYRKRDVCRKILSFGARIMIRLLFGGQIQDVNCPYRLMKTDVFKECFFEIPENTFAPNVCISAYAVTGNLRIFKTIVEFNKRTTGECSLKFNKSIKIALRCCWQTLSYRISKLSQYRK